MAQYDLIPNYVEGDFLTALIKNTDLLKNSDTFKDYNYHGANMTMLLELLAYLSDFSSFHTNMVAKNVFMDSANVYETVHSLASQKGYVPRGYVSSFLTASVTIADANLSVGDQVVVKPWVTIDTQKRTSNNEMLYYTITQETTNTVKQNGSISFDVNMREGKLKTLSYRGENIIDNKIILPFHNFDHGTYPFVIPSIALFVNDEEWVRVNDFYDNISGLNDKTEDGNVYMLVYDKYGRYVIEFSSSFNIPKKIDDIRANLLKSTGIDGIIGAQEINFSKIKTKGLSVKNITKNYDIPITSIVEFVNPEASVGGNNPESIRELKINSRANVHSQYRNITSRDYKYHLEARSDVAKGIAWGEQEQDPGNVIEYNKIYLSVIPEVGNGTLFRSGTINTETVEWVEDEDGAVVGNIEIPTTYNTDFHDDLLIYLEPRKMLNVYEIPMIPEIVYFRFDISIRTKRTYNFADVMDDVRNKLIYFFDRNNREFRETINFMDIENFIRDISITTDTNLFKNINGVDNVVIREVSTYTHSLPVDERQTIYEPNENQNFPQYATPAMQGYVDNRLRAVKLKYNQFAMLVVGMCRFYSEN